MAQRRLSDQELKTAAVKVGASIDPNDPRNVLFSGNEEAFRKEIQAVAERPPVVVDNTPEESSWGDASITTGLRVVPAIVGGLAGTLVAPGPGTAAGGAAGGALGESLAQWYEGTDLNPTQIAMAGALNAIPTARYLARGGGAVLRSIAPGVERRLAGMLAPRATSVGPGLLDRVNPRELARTVAQSATTGATVAPIENSASRYVQGQPTTRQDVTRDMTLGALLGGGTPVVGKIAQLPFRVAAPTAGSGIPSKLRTPEYTDTETAQRVNAANRASGRAEKPTSASSAASRGYTGSIKQQQDLALADLAEANSRIDSMLSEPNLTAIPLSDSKNLANQLRSLAGYFKGSKELDDMALTAQRFAEQVDGQVAVHPRLAHEVKKFLDAARKQSSFKKDPSQLSSQAALVDLSNSVRSDLKTALPQIADLLDFESQNYDILSGLYKSGAKTPSILSYGDVVTSAGLGGVAGYAGSPVLGATVAAANLGRRAIGNSPSARARTGNIINYLAGNEYDQIPNVKPLPRNPQPTPGGTSSTPPSPLSGSGEGGPTPPPPPPPRGGPTSPPPPPRGAQADARRRAQADARSRAQANARRRAQEDAGRNQRGRSRQRNERPGRRQTTGPDPYEALGIKRDATAAEIKSAYRDLVRKNHPDTVAGTMGDMLNPAAAKVKIDEATARMKIINAAWDRLKPKG